MHRTKEDYMLHILLKLTLQIIILTAFRKKCSFLWYCHGQLGHIVLPYYVLLSFRNHTFSDRYLNNRCTHSIKFSLWMYHLYIQCTMLILKFVLVPLYFTRICLLNFEKKKWKLLSFCSWTFTVKRYFIRRLFTNKCRSSLN